MLLRLSSGNVCHTQPVVGDESTHVRATVRIYGGEGKQRTLSKTNVHSFCFTNGRLILNNKYSCCIIYEFKSKVLKSSQN